MPSRIAAAFAAGRGTTGLIPYLTAGYPSLEVSLEILNGFAASGVRAIEVGIPFSDPIADGPDIQRASEWALRQSVGPLETLALVERFRRTSDTPVVVMTYFNPVLRTGAPAFAARARDAGVDGVLVSDLPAGESPEAWEAFDRAGLDTILLVAPTTPDTRLPGILERARGFLYCLARTGVTGRGDGYTGARGGAAAPALADAIPAALTARIATLRPLTALPLAIGFGVSSPADAAALKGVADAVVVGAAFMREIAADPARGAAERTRALAGALNGALR